MKIKSLILALVAVAFVQSAKAQLYGFQPVCGGGTNNIALSTTRTHSDVIDLTKRQFVGLMFSHKSIHADDVANVTYTFTTSVDGVNYGTTTASKLVVNVATTGSTTATVVTNFQVNAIGYLKLVSIQNACTNAITNVTVQASFKPGY